MASDKPIRIYQLAKELGMTSAELRAKITELGFDWDVSNHMKSLSVEQQTELDTALGGKLAAKKAAPKKAAAKKPAAKKPAAKKAAPKKAAAKKPAAKKPAAKKAAPKKAAAKKADEAPAEAAAPAKEEAAVAEAKSEAKTDAAPKDEKKRAPRGKKRDDDKRRRRRDDDGPDPEGFDPVPAAVAYLEEALKGMGASRARVTGNYDGRRLSLDVSGAGTDTLLGSRNAGAQPALIDALQTLTGRAAFGDRSGGKVTYIDVGGFRTGRVDRLKAASKRLAKFVAKTGSSVHIPGANNFDRYAFHNGISRSKKVQSSSEGFGVFRMLSITSAERQEKRTEDEQ